MNSFILDPQLQKDCIVIGKLELCYLLLMNNALVPWFILVPESDKTEIYELNEEDQQQLLKEINILSNFIKTQFNTDKLNIAALGNVVKQLHIHIIGRNYSDACWPKPVWGNLETKPYIQAEIENIKEKVSFSLREKARMRE